MTGVNNLMSHSSYSASSN